jgi:hypothetical protein
MELMEVKSLIWAQKGKLYIIYENVMFWFVESYGLVPQYLKLESTDGQTVKVDFNPSSSKSSYQDLSEEERQKIKGTICVQVEYDRTSYIVLKNF